MKLSQKVVARNTAINMPDLLQRNILNAFTLNMMKGLYLRWKSDILLADLKLVREQRSRGNGPPPVSFMRVHGLARERERER